MSAVNSALYAGHIKTNFLQKLLLATGGGVACYMDPRRGDMVAVSGETSGYCALKYMHSKMLQDETGKYILKHKPRINSKTVDLEKLRKLNAATFGKQYVTMLDKFKITPDSRLPVRFVDDVELAYVMQRYRETHDLLHLLLDQPTNLAGEIVVKWFEAVQTSLPMCVVGAVTSPVKLNRKQKKKFYYTNLPWVLRTSMNANFYLNYVYEDLFEMDIIDLREKLNIKLLPKTKSKK